jgi:hypothetical protein
MKVERIIATCDMREMVAARGQGVDGRRCVRAQSMRTADEDDQYAEQAA